MSDDPKNKTLLIRCSEKELSAWRREAASTGRNTSEWIREVLNAQIEVCPVDEIE